MENRKIIIEITESDVPPKITVDGTEVRFNSVNYVYDADSGEHKFNLVMPSIIDGKFQTHGEAFDRSMAKN